MHIVDPIMSRLHKERLKRLTDFFAHAYGRKKRGFCGRRHHLLTETDGPVRFSGPFKGKMTTPSFIPSVVRSIAELKQMKETDVANQILQNFRQLFGVTVG